MWNESVRACDGDAAGPVVSSRGCLPDAVRAGLAVGLSNGFELLQGEWLQVAPYGEFPHSRGLQRVDRAAAEGMARQFHSFRSRAGRLFGGVPFYVGHPDLPGASEAADRKAYGWVEDLEAREDGLFGRVKWSEAGLELLRNAHYKFLSPFWEAREIGVENGKRVYRPVALVSVGLTNQPNIPVRPLANEECLGDDEGNPPRTPPGTPPRTARRLQGDDADERSGRVEGIEALHCVAITDGLRKRRGELSRLSNRADRIQDCVRARMQLGLSYDEAWERVKRENQGWFES